MTASTLGTLIRSRRRATINPATGRPYTAAELAAIAGVSRQEVTAVETGKIACPSPEFINSVARVLPVTVAELCRAMGFAVELPHLSEEELRLVTMFRRTDRVGRDSILSVAEAMQSRGHGGAVPQSRE